MRVLLRHGVAPLRLELIIVVQRSKQRGARKDEREKGNGRDGGKRWNLLELSRACGREGLGDNDDVSL
jgi:hypothetical protein